MLTPGNNLYDIFPVPDDGTVRKQLLNELGGNSALAYTDLEGTNIPVLVRQGEKGTEIKYTGAAGKCLILQELHDLPDTDFHKALQQAIEYGAEAISVCASQVAFFKNSEKAFKTIILRDPENASKESIDQLQNHALELFLVNPSDNYKRKEITRDSEINSARFRDAGAGIILQLALALTEGHARLFGKLEAGTDPQSAAKRLHFRLSSGTSFLAEVAAARAFRPLWQNVLSAYHIKADPWLTLVTSPTCYSDEDQHINLLRATTQGLSAICGGADMLCILPYDKSQNKYNPFANRLALNIRNLLRYESYIEELSDPAGGSWYIEKLTGIIMEKAWEQFKSFEAAGGFDSVSQNGTIENLIEEERKKQESEIREGNKIMIGVNKYRQVRNEKERPV